MQKVKHALSYFTFFAILSFVGCGSEQVATAPNIQPAASETGCDQYEDPDVWNACMAGQLKRLEKIVNADPVITTNVSRLDDTYVEQSTRVCKGEICIDLPPVKLYDPTFVARLKGNTLVMTIGALLGSLLTIAAKGGASGLAAKALFLVFL